MKPILAIIQARMGSTRLPGKVLRPLGDRPTLAWVVDAATRCSVVDGVVVATTQAAEDDAIANWCHENSIPIFRGATDDVLGRFLGVLDTHPASAVVRLTADCPLLDPAVIGATVAAFQHAEVDYASTVHPRTLPRGLDVEVISANTLRLVGAEADGADRVHVTSFIGQHKERFNSLGVVFAPPADDLRLTLDTAEDAELLDRLVAELGVEAQHRVRVIELLRRRPDLVALNARVRQKAVQEG